MARIARVVVPDYPHRIAQRGNGRQIVFCKGADYLLYLDYLSETLKVTLSDIWAY